MSASPNDCGVGRKGSGVSMGGRLEMTVLSVGTTAGVPVVTDEPPLTPAGWVEYLAFSSPKGGIPPAGMATVETASASAEGPVCRPLDDLCCDSWSVMTHNPRWRRVT